MTTPGTATQTSTTTSAPAAPSVSVRPPQADLPATNREAAWRGDRPQSTQPVSKASVADMLNEVAALAAADPDDDRAQTALTKVLKDPRYAEIVARFKSRGQSEMLADQLVHRFIESARVSRYDRANPLQRLGYEMVDWAKEKWADLKEFTAHLIDAFKDNELVKATVKTVEGLIKQVDKLGVAIYEFASDPKKREEFMKNFGEGAEKAWKFIHDGAIAAWETIKKLDVKKMMKCAVEWASDFENWKKLGKNVGTFLKSMCDEMGLTQLATGLFNLGKHIVQASIYFYKGGGQALADLVTGNWDKLGENFSKNMHAALDQVAQCGGDLKDIGQGLFKTALALTGVADVITIIQCVAAGDWQGAAVAAACLAAAYLTFKVGKHLMKTGLKQFAKDGMKVVADRLGDEVVKEITNKVGSEALQKMCKTAGTAAAQDALQNLEKEITKQIAKTGSINLTHVMVKEIAANSTEKITSELLKKIGVKEIVANVVERELNRIASSSSKKIAKEFIEAGYKREVAMKMASGLKYAIGKKGGKCAFGKAFEHELKDILEEGITQKVKKCLLDNGMRDAFEKTWDEGIEKLALKYAKHGFDRETADMCKKAGREGFEEGLDRAVRKHVREGIEEAFKRFRETKRKKHHRFSADDPLSNKKMELEAAPELEAKEVGEDLTRRRKKPGDDWTIMDDRRKWQFREDDVDYAVRRKKSHEDVYSIFVDRPSSTPTATSQQALPSAQQSMPPHSGGVHADSSVRVVDAPSRTAANAAPPRVNSGTAAPKLVVESGGKASHREAFLEATRSKGKAA